MSRELHPVSAKVAIYNPERTKVLLTEYLPGKFGLPGGHLEADETPDQAAVREVAEELGVALSPDTITEKHFWRHDSGKIVLGFVATLPEDTDFSLDPEEVLAVHWTPLDDIVAGNVNTRSYDAFILEEKAS